MTTVRGAALAAALAVAPLLAGCPPGWGCEPDSICDDCEDSLSFDYDGGDAWVPDASLQPGAELRCEFVEGCEDRSDYVVRGYAVSEQEWDDVPMASRLEVTVQAEGGAFGDGGIYGTFTIENGGWVGYALFEDCAGWLGDDRHRGEVECDGGRVELAWSCRRIE